MATEQNNSIQLPPIAEPKKGGLGMVYSETTGAVGEVFAAIGTLASAGRMLAQNAEGQAAISRVETSHELLKAIGVEATGVEALVAANHLVAYIKSVR